MKRFAPFLLTAVALGIAGCTEDSSKSPTAPSISPRLSTVFAACSNDAHIQSDIERVALFDGISNGPLPALQVQFGTIYGECSSNRPQAREDMLAYIQFTINLYNWGVINKPSGDPAARQALVNHWNTMFDLVGWPRPNSDPAVLGADGAALVIFSGTGGELSVPQKAAMTVLVQDANGDPRSHLFTINPEPGTCLGSDNLVQTGPCYQFSANPTVDPRFSPKVTVGICEPVTYVPGLLPGLAHEDGDETNITTPIGNYPTDCNTAHASSTGSWTWGLADIGRRLAVVANRALSVSSAYAAHGGLGGVSEELSPFRAVDLMLFKATFSADALKRAPGTPEAGSWFLNVKDPGSVQVETDLGSSFSKPVVLNNKDAKCGPCISLLLRGTVTGGHSDTNGLYQVTWYSMSHGPNGDNASFVLRSGNDDSNKEIARLTYTSAKTVDQLKYNGNLVGRWSKDVKQRFDIIVNLDDHARTVVIGGVSLTLGSHSTSLLINGLAIAQDIGFVAPTAANLASIGAEFTGKDFVLGWDDIKILRLPDE